MYLSLDVYAMQSMKSKENLKLTGMKRMLPKISVKQDLHV